MANVKFTEQQAINFLDAASFAGLVAIYTFSLSYTKRIAFDKQDLTKTVSISSDDYFYGFIVACSAVGIVGYNNKGSVFTVTYIDEWILSLIEKKITQRSEKEVSWKTKIISVNEYFN